MSNYVACIYIISIPGQLGPWTTRPVDSSARSGQLGPYIADNSARFMLMVDETRLF